MLRCITLTALVLTSTACNLQKMAVDQTAGVLKDGSRAFDKETDPELAREAIPGSLKTMESFLEASPEQPILLKLLAEGYMNFAFGFIEDEAEALQDSDPVRANVLRKRALNYYLRARGYGLRLLALEHPDLVVTLSKPEVPSADALKEVNEDSLPGLFWTANAWAAAINAGKENPAFLAELPIARALVERAAEIDPAYANAGPTMTLGLLDAALPKALGGQPERAKTHFLRAQELTGGKFLMIQTLYARTVLSQLGDRAAYEQELTNVLAQDPDIAPNAALANRLAQRRAKRYLPLADDLFLE